MSPAPRPSPPSRYALAFLAGTVLCSALASAPRADTEVCGTYELATEWTAHDSPYLVTGDIFIPSTSRLRIGPGVTVRFAKPRPCELQKKKIDQIDWSDSMYTGIKAEGTLYVLGSEEKPVVFEPESPKAGAVGWDGLRLTGQKAGMAEIGFAVFRGANQAIAVEKVGFFIHHCLFEGNNTGIAAGLRGDVGIVNCDFIGNLSAGLVIRKAGPRIANNLFAGNRAYGIWADGGPAIQARYNAFWGNREEACYKCPYAILDTTGKNANGDACDALGNLSADPVFIGSPSYDAAREADVAEATPAHLVKDPELAKLEAKARAKEEAKAKAKRKKEYEPMGKGPYVLSKYSKLIDAGHPGKDFRDRDGSRNDIGLHGGPMGRIATDPF